MGNRIAPVSARVKCELAGDPHSERRPYANAMYQATSGRCPRIAERFLAVGHKIGSRLLEDWQNPAGSNIPPNQKLALVMHAALAEGAAETDALAPLLGLATEFGVSVQLDARASDLTLDELKARAVRESAEAIAAAIEQGRPLRVIEAEILEAQEALASLLAGLKRDHEGKPSGAVRIAPRPHTAG